MISLNMVIHLYGLILILLLISISDVAPQPFRQKASQNYDDRLYSDFSDDTVSEFVFWVFFFVIHHVRFCGGEGCERKFEIYG